MIRLLLISILAALLTACGDAQPPAGPAPSVMKVPNIDNLSGIAKPDAVSVMTGFLQACQGFGKYHQDISQVVFKEGNPVHREDILRGWTRKYELTFKVAGSPQHEELVDARAMGNTCFYDFGGGTSPGFVAGKTACAQLCGMPDKGFRSVANMLVLDDPTSDSYKQRHAALEATFHGYVAEYQKAALRGDYQAQRNLAYTYTNHSLDRAGRVTGCAWRLFIVHANRKANDGDKGNLQVDCSNLTEEEFKVAKQQTVSLVNSVKK